VGLPDSTQNSGRAIKWLGRQQPQAGKSEYQMTIEQEDIDLDAVRGVISVWEGILMGRVHAERAQASPDEASIAEMTQVMYESAIERKSLRAGDTVAIEAASVKYAALIAAYRTSEKEISPHG
jgi:hypothetical protein